MPIALIPAGEEIPLAVAKKRGRPVGSKNRPKPEPVEAEGEPIQKAEQEPAQSAQPEPAQPEPPPPESAGSSESESEPATPLPKRRPAPKRQRNPPAAPTPRVRQPREVPAAPSPESPRTVKKRHWAVYRDSQTAVHNDRRDRFTALLDQFMH